MPKLKVDHNHKSGSIKKNPKFLLAIKTAVISLSMAVFSGSAMRTQAIDKTIDSSAGITEELPEEELAKIQKSVEEELENLPLEPSSLEENEDVPQKDTDSKKMSIIELFHKKNNALDIENFAYITLTPEDIEQIDLKSMSSLKNLKELYIDGDGLLSAETIKQIQENINNGAIIRLQNIELDISAINLIDTNNTNLQGEFDIKISDKEQTIGIYKSTTNSAIFLNSLDSDNVNVILQNLSKLQNVPNLQVLGYNISFDAIKNLDEEFLSKITLLTLNATNTNLDNLQLLEEKLQNLSCIDIENIPTEYMKYLSDDTLSKIRDLEINIDNLDPNENFEFLEKCPNLEDLFISHTDENGKKIRENVYITDKKSFSLISSDKVDTNTILKALKGKDIEEVSIGYSDSISVETLKKLKQLKHLDINWFDDYSVTGDITELSFLEDISIPSSTNPYKLALAITRTDIESLRKQGVTIDIPKETEEKFLEIDARLEKMVQELRLPHDASDEEKMLAITKYVVNHCEYDSEFSGASEDEKDKLREEKEYYKEGFLYGALENQEHICGNFAALTQALAKRVGLESYVVDSKTHAYNLVNLDGIYYYIDTTFLDYMEERYVLESGDKELIDKLDWFKANPLDYEGMGEEDDAHLTTNIPSTITLDEKNTKSLDKENALFMYGKMHSKEIISALIGIGCAVGAGVCIKKSRNKAKDLKLAQTSLGHTQSTILDKSKEIKNLKEQVENLKNSNELLENAYKALGITPEDLVATKKMLEQSKNKGQEEPKKEEGMSIDGN